MNTTTLVSVLRAEAFAIENGKRSYWQIIKLLWSLAFRYTWFCVTSL